MATCVKGIPAEEAAAGGESHEALGGGGAEAQRLAELGPGDVLQGRRHGGLVTSTSGDFVHEHMGVSKIGGTPKWLVCNGKHH